MTGPFRAVQHLGYNAAMRSCLTTLVAALLLLAAPLQAQGSAPADATPTSTSPPAAEAAAATADPDEPTAEEHRLVAYVASGVSVVSLATGITFGVLAQAKYDCAADVIACNQGRPNKIVGRELFDLRNDIERQAIAADIAYLFAATSALVATVGYLQGFVFVDAERGAE